MKRERKDSKCWILLILLVLAVLILILLLGFCSQGRNEPIPVIQTQPGEQSAPTAGQAEVGKAATSELPTVFPTVPAVPPTAESCTIFDSFFPIRLGAYWEYRQRVLQNNRSEDTGWSVRMRYEVTEVTDEYADIIQSIVEGAMAGSYERNKRIWWDLGKPLVVMSFPIAAYVLPCPVSPNSSYTWPINPDAEILHQFQIDDWSVVTVPAGMFEVLCVSQTTYYEGTQTGYGKTCFAEGVGWVYDEWHSVREDGTTLGTEDFNELVSYSIP